MSATAQPVLRDARMQLVPATVARALRPLAETAPGAQAAEDAAERSRAELEAARVQVLEDARTQGEEEGRRRGYAEGLRLGEQAARVQAQEAADQAAATLAQDREALAALCRSMQGLRSELAAALEDDMLLLCHETVCRVLGEALLTPVGLRAQLARLRAAQPGTLAVHVHPQHAAWLDPDALAPGLRVVGDPAVALGGCLLRSESGALDARLESVLEEVTQALLRARGAADAGPGT